MCYKQADQQALDLVQVKAHDIRAFAASKAFYGGVSVDQIMQACHWKAHNTFANFYLKDLTWSDNDNNLYLGPVVAAQQVLDLSPQHDYPRGKKEKGWGGGGGGGVNLCNQVFHSLTDPAIQVLHTDIGYLVRLLSYIIFIVSCIILFCVSISFII